MKLLFFDLPQLHQQLLPLTYTRPIAALRIGIHTIEEKWKHYFTDAEVGYATQHYLQKKWKLLADSTNALAINGSLCPTKELVQVCKNLQPGQALVYNNMVVAAKLKADLPESFEPEGFEVVTANQEPRLITNPWHIFQYNGEQIRADFNRITEGKTSAGIADPYTIAYNSANIFVEKGAKIKAAILNAEDGPIYIGKDAQIHEGSIIKGPFALCEGSHVNPGGKMRGDTTVGPHSKVGGEISNSVIQGYSNKGHEGFLGNSVLGEWCNLGADTNNSNLKNNYAPVKLWSYARNGFANTGLQFCGLIMGDHSKCGINTMFNTGTVVGVSANIFGSGFPRNFVPSFSWGGASGFTTYAIKTAFQVAQRVMERRNINLEEEDQEILQHIFDVTSEYRVWEKTTESN